MSDKGWTLSMTNRHQSLDDSDKIFKKVWDLRHYSNIKSQSVLALNIAVLITHKEKDYEEAHRFIDIAENLINKSNIEDRQSKRYLIFFSYYRAEILFFEKKYEQSRLIFENILQNTKEIRWHRFNNYAQNWLAEISIILGDLDKAEHLLKEGLIIAKINNEKRRIAHHYESLCKLEKERGNLVKAIEWLEQAQDYFHRLGMKPDFDKMEELRKLISKETI
ncbi:hypothetical protein [Dolichospermum circinale]|uniref:hypothetical protein n=1 Tax=Dolichospermum circinale TaxID=109265 RepID=UPI00232F4B6A|nr:hypothetical protein [Dolichospermum circinale]MDB9448868.1 hypothetical protein [Dolichospermum circinale CS-547]